MTGFSRQVDQEDSIISIIGKDNRNFKYFATFTLIIFEVEFSWRGRV